MSSLFRVKIWTTFFILLYFQVGRFQVNWYIFRIFRQKSMWIKKSKSTTCIWYKVLAYVWNNIKFDALAILFQWSLQTSDCHIGHWKPLEKVKFFTYLFKALWVDFLSLPVIWQYSFIFVSVSLIFFKHQSHTVASWFFSSFQWSICVIRLKIRFLFLFLSIYLQTISLLSIPKMYW